ncbi:hypothetical protein [Mangrovibacillus cuniculi]|uniref:Uncharacterized protein n=1 Tax=Mangrovibacillus cuniculi TaxID=2593652 RepID=A0A7S8HFB5_9BACI|nr:hypothetical protein [Mangrovibacillus cuniculi]QPC46729.1 hypothetical protein G8O30_07010 [Mangrovibacillus cuniculi]
MKEHEDKYIKLMLEHRKEIHLQDAPPEDQETIPLPSRKERHQKVNTYKSTSLSTVWLPRILLFIFLLIPVCFLYFKMP